MKTIPLFWYSINKFRKKPKLLSKAFVKYILQKNKENYGDLLSEYLVKKISGRPINWYRPKINPKTNYCVIGSILNHSDKRSVIWGSGIIDTKHPVELNEVKAVRGPLTRKRLHELNFNCPEIYGDPALLLPRFYYPIKNKKYTIGIIPHYVDFKYIYDLYIDQPTIKVINLLTTDIERTTDEILECSKVISSSLHGMILAHAYGIPAIWVKFSNKLYGDNVKFNDYLLSVNLKPYNEIFIQDKLTTDYMDKLIYSCGNLPDSNHLEEMGDKLLNVCPF